MSTLLDHAHPRPFLNVTDAEIPAELGTLAETLSEAARYAEALGLPGVEEHLDAALAHVAERAERAGGA